MQLKDQDFAVIKQALRIAQKHAESRRASYSYREVLAKMTGVESKGKAEPFLFLDKDVFPYDYDDAAEI